MNAGTDNRPLRFTRRRVEYNRRGTTQARLQFDIMVFLMLATGHQEATQFE
jgi:hypothetical protein